MGQRPSSTKTRIKTIGHNDLSTAVPVRDHHPLKQGLRLGFLLHVVNHVHVRDHHPLKQGLRLAFASATPNALPVRDHHPLKQGLRPF